MTTDITGKQVVFGDVVSFNKYSERLQLGLVISITPQTVCVITLEPSNHLMKIAKHMCHRATKFCKVDIVPDHIREECDTLFRRYIELGGKVQYGK